MTTQDTSGIAHWCRVEVDGQPRLGRLENGRIALHAGDLFGVPTPTGESIEIAQARWLAPVVPRQFLGLWNNFHARQQAEKTQVPDHPLYFVKLAGSLAAHGQSFSRPPGFSGRVKFEAELGIVIGRECFQPAREVVDAFIFGYTCVNDVTAPEPLFANPEFHQWCRAKSFPGFGPVGPWIATGLDPEGLQVRAVLDGECLQDYPVGDMIFSPRDIVWHIAQEIVLYPGDVIACGTSLGAGDMREGQEIVVEIPGIGALHNRLR